MEGLQSCVSQSFLVGYTYFQFLVTSTAGSFWGDSNYSFPHVLLMDKGFPSSWHLHHYTTVPLPYMTLPHLCRTQPLGLH